MLIRFAYRFVRFDSKMAKSFYRLPEKEIRTAITELVSEGILIEEDEGYMLASDKDVLADHEPVKKNFVCALHRNDILYKAFEPQLKDWIAESTKNLTYDHEPLQYLLIDGEFHGASVGHFRNGPYDLNDIICDLPDAIERRDEIIEEIRRVNYGRMPLRFMGEEI